jgi:hypothetical protein
MRLFLLLAIVMGASAYVTHAASQQLYDGTPWAHRVCSTAGPFCKHPEWLGYGAAGFAIMALLSLALARR